MSKLRREKKLTKTHFPRKLGRRLARERPLKKNIYIHVRVCVCMCIKLTSYYTDGENTNERLTPIKWSENFISAACNLTLKKKKTFENNSNKYRKGKRYQFWYPYRRRSIYILFFVVIVILLFFSLSYKLRSYAYIQVCTTTAHYTRHLNISESR